MTDGLDVCLESVRQGVSYCISPSSNKIYAIIRGHRRFNGNVCNNESYQGDHEKERTRLSSS